MSKRFKFRLQRVLDFRETEKRERERELARKNYELREGEKRLDQIIAAQDAAPVPDGEMTMAEMLLNSQYHVGLRRAIERQRVLILEAADAVDQARDAYLEKAIETETLETLKERRKEEHREEVKLEDKRELDELVVQRHKRGGK